MSRAHRHSGAAPASGRVLLLAGTLAAVLGLLLVGALALQGGEGSRAAAQGAPGAETPTPQTDDSVPAGGVTMIGATPLEAPGSEVTWGVGVAGKTTELVRYAKEGAEGGWSLGPPLPSEFKLEQGPLAGQMTPQGDGVMLGTVPEKGGGTREVVLVRNPGGAFEQTAAVPAEGGTLAAGEEPLLKEGEALRAKERAPMLTPLDEGPGQGGALVVPVLTGTGTGVEHQVLHWDAAKREWSSEPIEIPPASEGDFRVLGIGASEPDNAWLLAQLSSHSTYPAGAVALFRRVEEEGKDGPHWSWKPVGTGEKEGEAQPLVVPVQHTQGEPEVEPFTVKGLGEPPKIASQVLTVTSEGVWIDGQRSDAQTLSPATTTLFFKPEGPSGGSVKSSWCLLEAGTSSGTPACEHELPEPLPSGPYRSIAWANGTPFGERVITGLPEGVSLNLRGESFERVLALGQSIGSEGDPGASYGAAFSDPHEGWLGEGTMPLHLTREPAPSRLAPWPVSFRHPMLAIAPEPGQPVGTLTSEAIAVGDEGAVARFKPNQGWVPESLFGPGELVEHPRLRAIAWPTPNRAYAVGDAVKGEKEPEIPMWLWRGETGLWEPDPAMPANFRDNMLGIAFDPANPARGYAVGSAAREGERGALLRYGKSWTEETELPSQVKEANFIAIAFAGSEAIVAYREPASEGQAGGLLVNDGAGWHVDEQAGAVMSGIPASVAGLPDGGAAFTTVGGPEGPRVYERNAAGTPWQVTPTPLPGKEAGSITLFREGGALRAIVAAGGVANEGAPAPPPPSFPPNLLQPLPPVAGGQQGGGVLRQTASGWRDEEHELDPASEQPGGYASHDLPHRPEPVLAVLVDPSGEQGWAVGGTLNGQKARLETGEAARYDANPGAGGAPLGAGSSQVPLEASQATFAIGGNAECAAPCGDRALAGVGPDVWLTSAIARARQIGVRAFLYTGPYVTEGKVNGPRSLPIPFAQELERYASIVASNLPFEVDVAASPQELDARPQRDGDEEAFERAFAGLPEPFGEGGPSGEERQACTHRAGCQAAYYARNSEGPAGTVRVIVLDDSGDVEGTQLSWLESQLEAAKSGGIPAIVIGNANVEAQAAAGDVAAQRVQAALVDGSIACQQSSAPHAPCGASAYFYDAPEENTTGSLRMQTPQGVVETIPTFGSGTLGYINVNNEEESSEFHGASGFLLGQVDVAAREKLTNRAPVTVRLIPSISELAIEPNRGGIVLQRSKTALFEGLARRPRAGGVALPHEEESLVDPYIPIPENCTGDGCASELFPEYRFSSSRPDIGNFVKPNLAAEIHGGVVEEGPNGQPIADPQSGLFCAYNSGTTIISIEAGGLKASLPVTVQAGSVREPCGTQPLADLPIATQNATAAAPPAPAPTPAAGTAAAPPVTLPPPPPPPPVTPPIRVVSIATVPPPAAPFFFLPPAAVAPVIFVPPPLAPAANPTPPSGTSAVTSPVEAAQREEEEEEAPESVSNQASAYHPSESEPSALLVLGIITLAAFAGASIRRRPRGGRHGAHIAPATPAGVRAPRRLERVTLRRGRGL